MHEYILATSVGGDESKAFPDYAPCSAAHGLVQIVSKQQLKEGWAMARNKVQFQKGLSEPGFERLYGTEELSHPGR